MNRFTWANARSLAEGAMSASALVCEAMTAPAGSTSQNAASIVQAGGIDVLDLMKENLLAPRRVVSLREIPGLDAIVGEPDGLRIGATVTLAKLADSAIVQRRYPALADAARGSASPQIRHVATLGGNLLQRPRCWYFRAADYHCLRKGGGHCFAIPGENQYHAVFDNQACAIVHPSTTATVLVALGATIELLDADGTARRLRLEDFFVPSNRDVQRENELKPNEIMTAIHLPSPTAGMRMAHLKQAEKDSFDWPLADVAVVLELVPEGACKAASVVLGAAAPVPHRASAAEVALVGRTIDDAVAREAGRAAMAGATPLTKNAYKLPLFETLVRRAILKAAGQSGG